MSCDREFSHAVLALPLLWKVRRDETVEDEVAVGARPVYLADEVVGVDLSGSRSSETPVETSAIDEV
jgi:hypothetical protein